MYSKLLYELSISHTCYIQGFSVVEIESLYSAYKWFNTLGALNYSDNDDTTDNDAFARFKTLP